MATALKRHNGGRVLVFVVGAFAEMSEDVSRTCGIIAHDLAHQGHVQRHWKMTMDKTSTFKLPSCAASFTCPPSTCRPPLPLGLQYQQ